MKINRIIEKIFEKQDKILENLNFENVSIYLFLKDEYAKENISNNFLFQFVFRSYYRLDNAGLSEEIKNVYFKLLENKQTKLESILLALYEIPTLKHKNTIQFSFATKLLHTIDNNLPIFDSKVGKIFNFKVNGTNKEKKVTSCTEIYDDLIVYYAELKKEEKIKEVISKFRYKFNIGDGRVADTKILDFIKLWESFKKNGKIPN